MHTPVLLKEVLEYLNPKLNQNFIDATVGDGGHAKEILKLTSPDGKLLAIDRDAYSIMRAKSNLSEVGNRALYINDSFGNIGEIAQRNKFGLADGILFDFGMSSSQLENSGRGFSFQKDEILDMRFDAKIPITAEDVVNDYSESELQRIFEKWGEEPKAKIVAREIVASRNNRRLKTTGELVKIIERVIRRHGKLNPATLVFQALRIEVNEEFLEIEKALMAISEIIKNGGRAVFISFHSLEDRMIKNWTRDLNKKNIIKILNKKPVVASEEEKKINPRSRSAKLRVIEIIK